MKTFVPRVEVLKEICNINADRFTESAYIPQLFNVNFTGNQNDGKTYLQRFIDKIAWGMSDCWFWIANRDAAGYGTMMYKGRAHRSHRVSWMLFNGDIPEGMKVLHTCDVRNCVNPDHLFIGTQADNINDMVRKKRHRSPCPRFGEANPVSKLTQTEVDEIRSIKGKYTQNKISKMFNVSPMTISRIMNHKLWRKR